MQFKIIPCSLRSKGQFSIFSIFDRMLQNRFKIRLAAAASIFSSNLCAWLTQSVKTMLLSLPDANDHLAMNRWLTTRTNLLMEYRRMMSFRFARPALG